MSLFCSKVSSGFEYDSKWTPKSLQPSLIPSLSIRIHFSAASLASFLFLEPSRRAATTGLCNSAVPLLKILFAWIFTANSLTFFSIGLNVTFSFNEHSSQSVWVLANHPTPTFNTLSCSYSALHFSFPWYISPSNILYNVLIVLFIIYALSSPMKMCPSWGHLNLLFAAESQHLGQCLPQSRHQMDKTNR